MKEEVLSDQFSQTWVGGIEHLGQETGESTPCQRKSRLERRKAAGHKSSAAAVSLVSAAALSLLPVSFLVLFHLFFPRAQGRFNYYLHFKERVRGFLSGHGS